MNSLYIALNFIKRLSKEKSSLIYIVVLPILAGVLAMILTAKPAPIKLGVQNNMLKSELVQYLEAQNKYQIIPVSEDSLQQMVASGQLKMGILLPSDLSDRLNDKTLDKEIKLLSLKENTALYELKGAIDAYVGIKYSGGSILLSGSNEGNGNQTTARMTIGFLSMFILLFTGSGIRLILEDKNGKTFMRTFCAPLKSYEMVLGSLIANFLLGLFQIAMFLILTQFVLRIDLLASMLDIFILLCAYLVASIGLDICLVGFIKSDKLYNAINSQLTTVICMLGGCFIPLSMLPAALQKSANFIPQKWIMDGFEQLTGGASLYDIRINLLILLLFGLVFFTFGVKTLRPDEADL